MLTNSRGAIRTQENSQLLVRSFDGSGDWFTEQTVTRDISETGISFYLENQVWMDTHLMITIASSSLFGPLHRATARVVRIQPNPSGKRLVAARFDE